MFLWPLHLRGYAVLLHVLTRRWLMCSHIHSHHTSRQLAELELLYFIQLSRNIHQAFHPNYNSLMQGSSSSEKCDSAHLLLCPPYNGNDGVSQLVLHFVPHHWVGIGIISLQAAALRSLNPYYVCL